MDRIVNTPRDLDGSSPKLDHVAGEMGALVLIRRFLQASCNKARGFFCVQRNV